MSLGPSLGWQIIDWVETFLCEGPGDAVGAPATLDLEYQAFIVKAYELHPAGATGRRGRSIEGRRTKRRAMLSRPKGRGKSALAAKVGCAEAIGPVRFDHWAEAGEVSPWGYEYREGEPVGRPVTSPEILCLATEEGQAGNTFDAIVVMLGHVAEHYAAWYPGLDVGITRINLPGGGTIEPVTARAKSKDGGNSTFTVLDEGHLWDTRELHDLAGTIRRNLGKRHEADPWSMETTTAFRPGDDSEAERFADMVAELDPQDVLLDDKSIPLDVDWFDDDALYDALVDVYGPAAIENGGWTDIERKLAEIRDPQSDEADSRRYFGNQVVVAKDQWLDARAFVALAHAEKVVADDDEITLGFDGGQFDDATALIGCRVSDGHLFTLGVWQRPDDRAKDDWEVPRHEVGDAVRAAFGRFRVWRMYADPPLWTSELDAWRGEFGEARVVDWWTNRDAPMAAALLNLHTAVVTGQVSHDGDSRLVEHVANARRNVKRTRAEDGENADRVLIKKERRAKKIDAAMAASLAFEARSDAIAKGRGKKKRRRARVRGLN
ncbi:MAG: hypothetical protein S0880_13165 [Actinomycetota bacterium]|nr:hypothetical protein [Actinomycetota bacterium]